MKSNEIVCDFKEINLLTNLWRQAVTKPFGFGLFIGNEVWGIP